MCRKVAKLNLFSLHIVKSSLLCACFCRDISNTALSSLPDSIPDGLQRLIAESAFHLKELPPLQLFTKLRQAKLTYPSHCCAFQNIHRNRFDDMNTDAIIM